MVSPKTASLYVLLALFVAALTAGIVLLVANGSGSPGVEILLPTATPTPELKVHVSGAIVSAGVYALNPGDRLMDVVSAAGGATEGARLSCVDLTKGQGRGPLPHSWNGRSLRSWGHGDNERGRGWPDRFEHGNGGAA